MERPESHKQKILIVDDVAENIRILIDLFRSEYLTFFARNGKEALEITQTLHPDLILLDIMMPQMDGYQTCERLKSNPETREIPVIFVSAMANTRDETKGLNLGAVDYITKPIRPAIVKARVQNQLKLRAAMQELKQICAIALDANPMTGLPGNNSIASRIKAALINKEDTCVIYADLDNFKAFNDKYGFAKGDEVILFTAKLFRQVLDSDKASKKAGHTFLGHVGGDDFVLMVPSNRTEHITRQIRQRFDAGITALYSPRDAAAGYIDAVNRKGVRQTFPLMSISLAGVDISSNTYRTYLEINDACAETKKQAKTIPGSSFFMDRRTAS